MTPPKDKPPPTDPAKPKLSFWRTLVSVLYALIGVQDRKNAQSSFEEGHLGLFIFVGILVVSVFVMAIMFVVHLAITKSSI